MLADYDLVESDRDLTLIEQALRLSIPALARDHAQLPGQSRLTDAERRLPRGAFWGSIHGTLTHILWGDQQWMSRFDNWPKPTTPIKQSAGMIENFAVLRAERQKADRDISRWAGKVDDTWLAEDLTWFSGAANREVRAPLRLLVTHFFNHQTHHRGQIHAMLTAAGQETGDTDLFLLVPDMVGGA